MHTETPSCSKPRARRSRRITRDAQWLADELSKGETGGMAQARAFVRVVDEVLRSVERLAWDFRSLAQAAGSTSKTQRHETSSTAGKLDEPIRENPGERAALFEKYQRLAATGMMLGQVALSYRMHAFRSAFVSRDAATRELGRLHATNARRFHSTSVAHGGAFLKVGQLLSARHDLLPAAWLEQLAQLQDAVPPVAFEAIRETLEADLGRPLGELFAAFDANSIAAASIGQVHRATTPDGQQVAVKVQRPGIAQLIESDLGLLDLFLDSVQSLLPPTDIETVRDEVKAVLSAETDYAQEYETMSRVASFFSAHEAIIVPSPLANYSGERVLTSAFIEGTKVTTVLDELAALRDAGDGAAGKRLDRIMSLLLEAYLRMVLELGVFQADPHPGNLLVTQDDQLVVLDFGAARALSDAARKKYIAVMQAFMFDDMNQLVSLLHDLGFRTASGRPDTLVAFATALLRQMRHAIQEQRPLQWPTKTQLLDHAADLLRQADRDPVTTLPPEFVMVGRVFGTLGGLFGHYRPNVDVGRVLLPLIGQALAR